MGFQPGIIIIMGFGLDSCMDSDRIKDSDRNYCSLLRAVHACTCVITAKNQIALATCTVGSVTDMAGVLCSYPR